MNIKKQLLRQRLLDMRHSLSSEKATQKSAIICNKLLSLIDWTPIKTVHIYTSVQQWREVDTRQIVRYLETKQPHIKVTTRPASKKEPLPQGKFDLIIVPVLGFDKHGYRLGLGGGWYDRFLANQPSAKKVGLAYAEACVDDLPHELHDIPLEQVIVDV